MLCAHCNTETNNPKFCSSSCSASHNNKLKPKRKLGKHTCRTCSVPIRSGYTFCGECFVTRVKDLTLEEAIYTNHHKSSAFALVRSRARAVVGHLPKACVKCGYDRHVEICHIRPVKDFPLSAKMSEVNSPENLLILCPNCHWELDHPKP